MLKNTLFSMGRYKGSYQKYRSCQSNAFDADIFRKKILYEDNHLLVVNKPPGMLSQGDITKDKSYFDWSKMYLSHERQKPLSSVYLGLVHRIDRVTSGVLVFAKTSKAACRLSADFRDRLVKKSYVCVVNGPVQSEKEMDVPDIPSCGELLDMMEVLTKPQRGNTRAKVNKSRIVTEGGGGGEGKKAHLHFEQLCTITSTQRQKQHVLHIRPTSGRKHQIRLQLSHKGWPIIGDVKYGAPQRFAETRDIALHSLATTIRHPTNRDQWVTFTANVPESWTKRFGVIVVTATKALTNKIEKQAIDEQFM